MEWKKGKPPTVGWYPVKRTRDPGWTNGYRWWDGELWSWPAFPHENAEKAGRWARYKEPKGHNSEFIWGDTNGQQSV